METCKFYETIATYSGAYKANRRIKPRGIVIHSTGAENPNLWRWVNDPVNAGTNTNQNYFGGENDERQVTPHAVFGLDIDNHYAIEKILPYDYRCWGCGNDKLGSFNDSHIQIEIAEDYGLTREYLLKALNSVCEWAAYLCIEHNIDVANVVSHKEAHDLGYASNHGDPEHWLSKYGITMDNVREKIREWIRRIESTTESVTPPVHDNNKLWRVQVGAFSSEKNARDYCKSLQEKYGLECFVVVPK